MSREKWKKQRSFTKNSWKSYTNRDFLAVLTRFWRRKVENKKTWSELQVFLLWRRVRDLNPRTAHHRYTISSRAPSTTQPTLHMVAEEGFEPSQTESESVVLPLHNSAIFCCFCVFRLTTITIILVIGKKSRENFKLFWEKSCFFRELQKCSGNAAENEKTPEKFGGFDSNFDDYGNRKPAGQGVY